MFRKGTMLTALLVAGAMVGTGGAQQPATPKAQGQCCKGRG
jgi:hypothetical protein